MGIFDFFKKKNNKPTVKINTAPPVNQTPKKVNSPQSVIQPVRSVAPVRDIQPVKVENDVKPETKEIEKKPAPHDMLISEERKRLANCVYDLVVIDFETTGLKSPLEAFQRGVKHDEVLSVSVIDQDGNVLLNTLCKPKNRKTWAKAQEIHGISPAMVKDKQPFEDIFPAVKEILLKSKLVIAYNIAFECGFLFGYDVLCDFVGEGKLREKMVWGSDPMLMYSGYKGVERWQKLTTAARHFKYNFEAHDSLEDVKATLYCYKKLIEYINANEEKEYIYRYGFLYDIDVGIKGKWLDMNTYDIKDETLIKK